LPLFNSAANKKKYSYIENNTGGALTPQVKPMNGINQNNVVHTGTGKYQEELQELASK